MTTTFFHSRRDMIAAAFAVLIALGGMYAIHATPEENADEDEDTAEFHDTLKSSTKSIDGMIADTKAGKNVSDFRLGMFTMSLLNTLSDRDPELGKYFHQDGRMMQSYLTDVFQYHDTDEIAKVTAMAQATGDSKAKPAVRLAARDALESLRHIPEGKQSPEEQTKSRAALIDALTALNADLGKAAKE